MDVVGPIHVRRRPRTVLARTALLVALLAGFVHGAAGEQDGPPEDPARLLDEAKTAEMSFSDYPRARALYERVLQEDLRARLTCVQRGVALAGRARCAEAEGLAGLATQAWEAIVADATLDADLVAWARERLEAARRARGPDADEAMQRREAEQAERRRRLAADHCERARNALDRSDHEAALEHALQARAFDPGNERALALVEEIRAARVDPARLLAHVMAFVQTRALAERRTLDVRLEEAERDGRAALGRGDHAAADRAFRDAIHRIDSSGFLEVGAVRGAASLLDRRTRLVNWLVQVHDKANAAGEGPFASVPPLPPPEERVPGIEGQLMGLLARLFSAPERGEESLRFHAFAPAPTARTAATRPTAALSPRLVGAQVRLEPGTGTRAGWAEHWIARERSSGWIDPTEPDAAEREERVRRSGGRTRLLARFGDTLAVQHGAEMHRRIEALAASFDARPPAMHVDAALFAATTAGVVRIAETLDLHAEPGADGAALVHREGLWNEAVARVEGLEGVWPLGTVGLDLAGSPTARVRIEQRTADHPGFKDLPPPALTVPAVDAAYGIDIDLYAEDMPFVPGGLPRSAVGLAVRTTMPTHSTVLPRLEAGPDRFQRVPRMGTHGVEAWLELPHFGTLVVLGLPNPLVPSQNEGHELVLLVGVRRADDPIPDAPAPGRDPRVVGEDALQGEHRLGRLGESVEDQAVGEGWPAWAPADLLDRPAAREARDRYLARLLARMAGLVEAAPLSGAPHREALPTVVHDGRVAATLPRDQHERLAEAAARLRAQGGVLHRLETETLVVEAAALDALATDPAAVEAAPGAFRVPAAQAEAVRARLVARRRAEPALEHADVVFAAPTQQVAVRHVVERGIVADLAFEDGPEGRVRRPVYGRIADGLVLEVRPDLESEGGLRGVAVRLRVARLDRVDREPHPSDREGPIPIDVPAWHPAADGLVVAERTTTDVVGDGDLVVVGVRLPGDPQRALLALVRLARP